LYSPYNISRTTCFDCWEPRNFRYKNWPTCAKSAAQQVLFSSFFFSLGAANFRMQKRHQAHTAQHNKHTYNTTKSHSCATRLPLQLTHKCQHLPFESEMLKLWQISNADELLKLKLRLEVALNWQQQNGQINSELLRCNHSMKY